MLFQCAQRLPDGALAIAWCTLNPHVSTVMTGASRVDQVEENMAALEVRGRLDADVLARIYSITSPS